jgi:hypothetical protein
MTRLESLKDREEAYDSYKVECDEKIKDFINLGRQLISTREGKEFFWLAKEIYYDENEFSRDNLHNIDLFEIGRLQGEEYILRKIVMQFLNNMNENSIAVVNVPLDKDNKREEE